MLIEFLTIGAGIIIILALAELIIKNSISLAEHFGLSGTFVGLTVLSIGTSIPEIMSHIIGSIKIVKNPAEMKILSGLLLGSNIGSDIFQQTFILGAIGIIATIIVKKKNLYSEFGGLMGGALLVWFVSFGGFITRIEGLLLLLAYLGYLLYLQTNEKKSKEKPKNNLSKNVIAKQILIVLISFVIIAFVTGKVLNSAELLVKLLPISASFFGVILLGIASALPELTTSLLAVLRGKSGITTGILIGSNITNPLFGIGIGALISGYAVPRVVVLYDLPIRIVLTALIFYFLLKKEDLAKWKGVLLIILFIVYVIIRNIYFPIDF